MKKLKIIGIVAVYCGWSVKEGAAFNDFKNKIRFEKFGYKVSHVARRTHPHVADYFRHFEGRFL